MTDEQYGAIHAQKVFERDHTMADEIAEDHLIQLNKNEFMSDEQYQVLHQKQMYEKEHPMADDIEDDHLLQT